MGTSRGESWILIALGVGLFAIYESNGRCIGSSDNLPATLLAAQLARGEGPFLDRYAERLVSASGPPYYLTVRGGHLLSRYPVGPAVVAAPLIWLQMQACEWLRPRWRDQEISYLFLMSKHAAAAMAAATVVGMAWILRKLDVGRGWLPAVIAAALGSELWVVASQGLWQHGPVTLGLTLSLAMLLRRPLTPPACLLSGLFAGSVLASRMVSSVYVLPLAAWTLWRHPRRFPWLVVGILPAAVMVTCYNYAIFGTWQGGTPELQVYFEHVQHVSSRWRLDASFLGSLAGTLLSPNRGLFTFCPWIAVSILLMPATWARLRRVELIVWLVVSLIPSTLLIAGYGWWWAGWSFGPRFWTDATPLFAILVAVAFDWAWSRRSLPWTGALGASILAAIVIQATGAYCYPSSWNAHPADVDAHHERVWDWRDTEIARCFREGPHPAAFHPHTGWARDSALGVARLPGGPSRGPGNNVSSTPTMDRPQ